MKAEDRLSNEIIGAAIEVHKQLGPGLLESAYEYCLAHELGLRNILFERQKELPVVYKNVPIDCGYRLDRAIAYSPYKTCHSEVPRGIPLLFGDGNGISPRRLVEMTLVRQ